MKNYRHAHILNFEQQFTWGSGRKCNKSDGCDRAGSDCE